MAVGQPNINGYLTRVANHLLIPDKQSKKIQKQIKQLRYRLNRDFEEQVSEISVFGSYSRKTALASAIDSEVDIDLMIVFSDRGWQPQTYLERLKRFSDANYPKNLSKRDHPAVVLNLAGMKFDLVPAVESNSIFPYKIPERGRILTDWRRTDPKEFNDELVKANKQKGNIIKPLIRCVKYWNVVAGRPFNSYELERHILFDTVDRFFRWKQPRSLQDFFFTTIQDFFFTTINDLFDQIDIDRSHGDEPTELQLKSISSAKSTIREAHALERKR